MDESKELTFARVLQHSVQEVSVTHFFDGHPFLSQVISGEKQDVELSKLVKLWIEVIAEPILLSLHVPIIVHS
jgi:hypothetical protein